MAGNEVVVKFLGDSSSFDKTVSKVITGLGASGSGFEKYAKVAGVAGLAIGAVGGALFKIGSDFDEVNDHIRVSTGATGERLKGLEGDFKDVIRDVPTDFKSAGDAVSFVAQKMDATGKTGKALSEQFLVLSHITGTDLQSNMQSATDALQLFNVPASVAPNFLDMMFRASQKSGLAFADIASQVAGAGTTLKPFGFTLGTTTALVASLGKAGLDTSDVIPAMGKALAKAAKDGVPAYKFLTDTFNAIKKAPNDTKAAAVAMDVFGAKAGPKFAGLVREGKLSFDDMMQSIGDGKDTIIKAGADTEDFGEKWTKIKNQVFVAIEPVATRLFNAVGSLADKFSNLSPGMQQATIIGVGLVAVIGGIGAAITVLAPVVAGIGVAIGVLTSPITLVIAAIALLAFLVVKHWDTIKDAFGAATGWIGDHMGTIGRVVLAFATGGMSEVVRFIGGHLDDVVDFFKKAPGRIASATHGMWNGISAAFKAAMNYVIDGWNALQFKIPGFSVGPAHFAGFTLGVPDIPRLAHGGVVRARPGGTLVDVGEGGEDEVVAPLSKLGGMIGGGDVHIHVHTGQLLATERDVEQAIVNGLESHFAHGGAVGNRRGAYIKP